MATATTDDRVLTLSRVIAASPEKLFDAWTKPDIILKWWGPEGATVTDHSLDVRIGGAWKTAFLNAGNRFVCSGIYKLIERPRRLALTWAWQQPDGERGHETVVEVSFEKIERGTRMTIVQKTFADAGQTALHNQGWTSSLNKFVRLFVKPDKEDMP
jgi:uncharacterized protein YndB with AHSA1/START domain